MSGPVGSQDESEELLDGEYTEDGVDRRVGTDLYGLEEGEAEEWRYGLPKGWFSLKKLWLFMGPGFLMSIAFLVRITCTPTSMIVGRHGYCV